MNRINALLGAGLVCGILGAMPAWADSSLAARPSPLRAHAIHANLIDIAKVGDRLLAVGDWGVILQSQDGGESWEQQPSPVSVMLNKAVFVGDQRGWIVGHDANILTTRDGGTTWTVQYRDPDWGKPLYDILMLDDQRGFAVGANSRMLRTADSGGTWEIIEPDFTFNGVNLYGIAQLADGTLLIHGEKGMLVRSTDEGESWEQLWSPYAASYFGMQPFGDSGAYLYGLRGTVYAVGDVKSVATQDPMEWDEFSLVSVEDEAELAAQGFRYYPNPLKESLFGSDSLGGNDVLIVGVNGAVVRNEGGRIEPVTTGLEMTLGDVLITDGGLVVAGIGGVTRVPFRK